MTILDRRSSYIDNWPHRFAILRPMRLPLNAEVSMKGPGRTDVPLKLEVMFTMAARLRVVLADPSTANARTLLTAVFTW